ncbi:hypothetical protein DICVIV_10322 [Dictyocaulus viviparus]|uniref:Uncharacterized protein n=1 Tax=Dictyocaulus viviparus TaxID=29172 RepID=A0A0D8XIQ7_DICVI|nr:hypothetical protein DICVIV_10322 [Dictyocaulus viviparus]
MESISEELSLYIVKGDLLMECLLEADPPPVITWQHAGNVISQSARVSQTLSPLDGILYKANLTIKELARDQEGFREEFNTMGPYLRNRKIHGNIIDEPNVGDGGAYKCTARNQLGESNANINLNFAGLPFRFSILISRQQ